MPCNPLASPFWKPVSRGTRISSGGGREDRAASLLPEDQGTDRLWSSSHAPHSFCCPACLRTRPQDALPQESLVPAEGPKLFVEGDDGDDDEVEVVTEQEPLFGPIGGAADDGEGQGALVKDILDAQKQVGLSPCVLPLLQAPVLASWTGWHQLFFFVCLSLSLSLSLSLPPSPLSLSLSLTLSPPLLLLILLISILYPWASAFLLLFQQGL